MSIPLSPPIKEMTLTHSHITLSPAPAPMVVLLSRIGRWQKEGLLNKWIRKSRPFANYMIWLLPISPTTLSFPSSVSAMLSILFYESIKIVSALGSFKIAVPLPERQVFPDHPVPRVCYSPPARTSSWKPITCISSQNHVQWFTLVVWN